MLTRTEELILLAVWKLSERAYGAAIQEYLSSVTGDDWSFGALYVPLERMASRGLVRSSLMEKTAKRGGRRKRCYSLTNKGVAALSQLRSVQDTLWQGLDPDAFRMGHVS